MPSCLSRNLFPPAYETKEKRHGRLEIRRIWTSTRLNGYVDFPYCAQVARVERVTRLLRSGKTRTEAAHLITSLTPEKASPQRLLRLNRGHWGIENGLHWVRDVTFAEDLSQIRTGAGPQVMATLRNLAISLIRLRLKACTIAREVREMAARPHLALAVVGL